MRCNSHAGSNNVRKKTYVNRCKARKPQRLAAACDDDVPPAALLGRDPVGVALLLAAEEEETLADRIVPVDNLRLSRARPSPRAEVLNCCDRIARGPMCERLRKTVGPACSPNDKRSTLVGRTCSPYCRSTSGGVGGAASITTLLDRLLRAAPEELLPRERWPISALRRPCESLRPGRNIH